MRLIILLLCCLSGTFGLQRGFLYPHGRGVPDQILPPQDDASSPELFLRTPIVFYNEAYKSVFVNSNGLLSFITELPRFYNLQFPLDYPVIAPLYSNVDVRAAGVVYYRETQEDIILDRATRTIRAAFSRAKDFTAKSVLVVTWLDVGYHKQGADKVNTFQIAVISDGEDSYVELLYPDHGIQWIQGSGQGGGLADALAQAGFISGDGRMHQLKGSGSDQVRNLNEWSNVDNPGRWLFHIGLVGEGNVDQPDLVQEEEVESTAFCSSGSRTCHSRATCSDFESGFCCICQSGFFGNGKNCLSEVIPFRVNGKLSGEVNGISLTNLDLQAYVVPADGRTYTAISVVPGTIGYDMQSLNVLGSTIGWLFARPVKGAVNGYQLTGGLLNQTVTLRFPQTGHQLTLTQRFTGLDVFQQLTMNGQVQGTLPNIPAGSKIVIKEYEEQYTRVALGQLIAQSSQVYQLEGSGVDNSFTVEQAITFDECAGTVPPSSTMRLKVVRTFVGYEERDGIIRYASTNKIIPLGVDEDPCRDGAARCGPYSTCVVEGDSFRCVCNPGFETTYTDEESVVSCSDADECASGLSNCDPNAACINTVGSYQCQCNPGFTSDGDNCLKIKTCDDIQCDPNAECLSRPRGGVYCLCKPGYHGNGTVCSSAVTVPDDSTDERPSEVAASCYLLGCTCPEGYDINESETVCTLRRVDGEGQDPSAGFEDERTLVDERTCVLEGLECHPYASCVLFTRTRQPACECKPGYRGNGRDCVPLDAAVPEDECSSPADCVGDASCDEDPYFRRRICNCYPGFVKDPLSRTCHKSETDGQERDKSPTCLELNNCHYDAQCVVEEGEDEAVCKCNPGFEGNGYSCQPIETGCNVLNDCASNADCLYSEIARGYRCQCRQGYVGDGHSCTPKATCNYEPSLCGEFASCLLTPYGEYQCQCINGYVGNGKICRPASTRIGNFLLIAQGMAVLRVPFQPTSTDRGRPIVMQPYQQAIGIDADCSENRVYWSDITGGNLFSSDYTGQDIKTLIGSDIGSAEGVSVDWLSRNIFWTDSARDTIEVASLDDSSLRKIIINEGLVNPRGLAVHPSHGKVFWADWNRAAPKIEWANMDGSERSIFLQGPRVKLPNSLAIDFNTDELCWADAGTFSIDCIGIGNRYERTVATNLSYPFGLTISQDHYYWTDWISQKIERVTRPGQVIEKPIPPPLGSSGKLYGVVAVADSCPRLSNVCQHERGRCPTHHLCLLNGNNGRSCVCASPKC